MNNSSVGSRYAGSKPPVKFTAEIHNTFAQSTCPVRGALVRCDAHLVFMACTSVMEPDARVVDNDNGMKFTQASS